MLAEGHPSPAESEAVSTPRVHIKAVDAGFGRVLDTFLRLDQTLHARFWRVGLSTRRVIVKTLRQFINRTLK